jgi:hypothetical protein
MKRFLFLLLFLPFVAFSQYATIQWDHPTTRVDNTPLSVDEISHYILSCGLTNDLGTATMELPGDQTAFEITRHEFFPEFGTYQCAMRTVLHDGLYSQWSNTIQVDYPAT